MNSPKCNFNCEKNTQSATSPKIALIRCKKSTIERRQLTHTERVHAQQAEEEDDCTTILTTELCEDLETLISQQSTLNGN